MGKADHGGTWPQGEEETRAPEPAGSYGPKATLGAQEVPPHTVLKLFRALRPRAVHGHGVGADVQLLRARRLHLNPDAD